MCYITAAWIKSFLMKRRYHGVKGGKKERECSINLGESQPDQISSVCTTFLCQLQDLCGLPMVWYTVQKSCTGGRVLDTGLLCSIPSLHWQTTHANACVVSHAYESTN